jgi:pyruvate dehydrogenase E2 component (dihydrolipoyllysine-residue acetyltransferase)
MSEGASGPRGLAVKQVLPLGRVRKVMAQSMRESVTRAALSLVSTEMDLGAVQAARQAAEAAGKTRYSINVFVMAAVARTLPDHPLLNAELVDDKILAYAPVNLGMAVAVPDGLIVAVIRDANQKSLGELSAAAADAAARARNGKLNYADIEGGTFTVSNLGMYGVDGGFPVPRPPEGAILLVGRARPRPELFEGGLVNRDHAWFSLTFDHRFIDGAAAAKFLQAVQALLLKPELLD